MIWPGTIRLATPADVPTLNELIPLSVRALQTAHYSKEQMDGAIGSVFGVDMQLIHDRTYFVAEENGQIVGCGGWSRRKSTCGSSTGRLGPDREIDPTTEAPRIRAFFVHPNFARRGIGSAILKACEDALQAAGFRRAEIAATLTGERLYETFGYESFERFDHPLDNGLPLPCVRMRKNFEGTNQR